MHMPARAIPVNATGQVDANRGVLSGAVLVAAAAAATAVVRTGGGSGAVIARLSAAANTSVDFQPNFALPYENLHVTLTGASAEFIAYV